MPIRFGDAFLFVFCVLVICVCFGIRHQPRDSSAATASDKRSKVVQAVEQAPTSPANAPAKAATDRDLEATGRKANVAGIWGTFECVEYRFDNQLEVHVHQVDEIGHQLEPSRIHREPYEHVLGKYVDVTSW